MNDNNIIKSVILFFFFWTNYLLCCGMSWCCIRTKKGDLYSREPFSSRLLAQACSIITPTLQNHQRTWHPSKNKALVLVYVLYMLWWYPIKVCLQRTHNLWQDCVMGQGKWGQSAMCTWVGDKAAGFDSFQ